MERKRGREKDGKERGENKRKYLSRLFGETWKRIGKNGKSAQYIKLEDKTVVQKISFILAWLQKNLICNGRLYILKDYILWNIYSMKLILSY